MLNSVDDFNSILVTAYEKISDLDGAKENGERKKWHRKKHKKSFAI